jgi:hypothetical protein
MGHLAQSQERREKITFAADQLSKIGKKRKLRKVGWRRLRREKSC